MKQQPHIINKALIILLMAALPFSVMATVSFTGAISTEFNYSITPGNWGADPSYDADSRIDATLVNQPVMTSGTQILRSSRIKNTVTLTVNGGDITWNNDTSRRGLAVFGDNVSTTAKVHMTGGHITVDTAAFGYDNTTTASKNFGMLDLWGNSIFEIVPAPALGQESRFCGLFDITVNTGSVIDIRGDGQLRIPDNTLVWDQDGNSYGALADALKLKLEGYALDGRLVAGDGGEIAWTHDVAAAQWVITAIPEPGTLALLGVGLCSFLLIRRRRA